MQIPSVIKVDMEGVYGCGVVDFTLWVGYKDGKCGLSYYNDRIRESIATFWCGDSEDCLARVHEWLKHNKYNPNKQVYKSRDLQPIPPRGNVLK